MVGRGGDMARLYNTYTEKQWEAVLNVSDHPSHFHLRASNLRETCIAIVFLCHKHKHVQGELLATYPCENRIREKSLR